MFELRRTLKGFCVLGGEYVQQYRRIFIAPQPGTRILKSYTPKGFGFEQQPWRGVSFYDLRNLPNF